MNIDAQAAPADDFDVAFETFSSPGGDVDPTASAAAAVEIDKEKAAATGGGDGSGNADEAVVAGVPAVGDGAAGGDGGAAAAAGGEGEAVVPAGGAEGEAAAAAGEGGAAAAAEAPVAEAVPAAAAPADGAKAEDVLAKLSELVAKAKVAEPAAAEAPKEEAKPLFTKDEQTQLEQYDKDWPDVAKCEALRRRGEYSELLGYVFQQVQEFVKPLQQTLDSLAGRTHLTDVKTAVPGYSDDLRQQVIDWVQTQPPYLQPAYAHVVTEGTVDEVKDLVERYRQATGQAAPAAGAALSERSSGRQVRTNELSGAAKEAAAALAPVESKRSEVLTPGDPSNYDDAWSQFSKDLA